MTLLADANDAPLSPFFARARWVGVFDVSSNQQHFLRNVERTADHVVDLICRSQPQTVIIGFVDDASAARLAAAGIELRWGPCSVPASALICQAPRLPVVKI